MGVDFIRARAKTFTRSWDQGRIELAKRTLFTCDPAYLPRTAIATTSAAIVPRTILIVRWENGTLVGYHELTPVAYFVSPPADLVSAIQEHGGCAEGEVTSVHDSTVEIAI
jgi:hypothetical protein